MVHDVFSYEMTWVDMPFTVVNSAGQSVQLFWKWAVVVCTNNHTGRRWLFSSDYYIQTLSYYITHTV